ncbi:hypothetical protein Tco_1320615 [Tanacetum coccineum]
MERTATTASSLDVEQDSGNINRTQSMAILNESFPQGTNSGSGPSYCCQFWATAKAKTVNGKCQLQALVDKKKVIITETSIRSDLHLEDAGGIDCLPTIYLLKSWQGWAKEIASLKKRVQKLERKKKSRTTGLKRLRKVGESRRVESSKDKDSLGAQEDASKQGRSFEDIDKDAEVSLVDESYGRSDDAEMFDTDDLHGDEVIVDMVVVTTVGEGVTATKIDEITSTSAPTTTIDEITLAQTLIEIKAAKPKVVTTAATTTTTTRPKARGVVVQEPTKGQNYDGIQKLFDKEMKRVNSFVAMNLEAQEISRKKDESSSKKAKIAQDTYGDIKDDDMQLMLYHLLPNLQMLQAIDREDLQTLWKLVKTKHGDTRPEDEHERVL